MSVVVLSSSSFPNHFKPYTFKSQLPSGNFHGIITTTSQKERFTCSSLGLGVASSSSSAVTDTSEATLKFVHDLSLADLDPATAKLAIAIIGPLLSLFSFLFILRVIMSWYPKLPVGKFPYVIAYAPTEPFLVATRKLIPPLAGVDITPVVWVGLTNFLNEILVGPQGLLVILSQQLN